MFRLPRQDHADSSSRPAQLSVDSIVPGPWQPRKEFDPEALRELAENIRRHGLLQPVVVRPGGSGKYELIAGERRLRACVILGERRISAVVLHADDRETALLSMTENLQRENLGFFEEAEAYRRLTDELGLTQSVLADSLGLKQSTVANKMRLLRLSPEVRDAVIRHSLTERHARALLRLHDADDQLEAVDRIVTKNLSVRQAEEWIEKSLSSPPSAESAQHTDTPHFSKAWRDWRLFANSMKSAVDDLKSSGLDARFSLTDSAETVEMRVVVPKSRFTSLPV